MCQVDIMTCHMCCVAGGCDCGHISAKTESLRSAQKVEELYSNALNAMRRYSEQDTSDGGIDDEDIF